MKHSSSPVFYFIPLKTYPCPNWFFSYTVVPFATILPLLIINILSDKHYAYYILCVVISIVFWLSLSFKIIFHVSKRIFASMPVVGSSSTTNLGFPIKLIAKESLRRIPPENVLTFPYLFWYKQTDSKLLLICYSVAGQPLSWQNILTCCSAESSSHKISNWGQTPIILRI